jgi:hypothetical protein
LMMGSRAFWASSSYLEGSLLYCSIYIRMVAPDDPVPDRRKMIREPSAYVARLKCVYIHECVCVCVCVCVHAHVQASCKLGAWVSVPV